MKLPVPMTIAQIAGFVGGAVHGSADVSVTGMAVNPLESTQEDIALVVDPQLVRRLPEIKAGIVISPVGTEKTYPDRAMILVTRPKMAIQKICAALQPKKFHPDKGIHPTAVIDPTAEIAEGVSIGPLVVVGPQTKIGAGTVIMPGTVIGGKVTIGEKCVFHPGCLIADYVRIGNRVTLQQGASIGSDGFGYTTERPANFELMAKGIKELSDERNPLIKIPQIGIVIIEDDVEIGSNTTIDRATIGATVVGQGTKIDNLVQISHNTQIGKDVIIISQVAIAGSCKIGDRAILAGGAMIADHITVGKDAVIEGCAGVMKDVPDAEAQGGIPALEARGFFKQVAHVRRLPKLNDEVRELKKRVMQLEKLLLEKQLTSETKMTDS